jgi:hypothetical protein
MVMNALRYSVILSNVGSCCDRFLSTGYSAPFTLELLFDRVASIESVTGVELVANWHVTPGNLAQIRDNLGRTSLKAVSTIPYLEFIYWLKKTEYRGWVSMDQYPYREDGRDAVDESIQWMKALERRVDAMDSEEVERVIHGGSAVESSRMLRKCLLG